MSATDFDVLIVGSGPSGAHAAAKCVEKGVKTALIDVGFKDDKYRDLVPDEPFSHIRATRPDQHRFFLGDDPLQVLRNQARAGVHLTPARQHMIRQAETLMPLVSDTFLPLQSTGHGGLGISWGANAFSFEEKELRRMGLPGPAIMAPYYREASREAGVSGDVESAVGPLIGRDLEVQPPLPLDENAEKILRRYEGRRAKMEKRGFFMGQALLAMLSRPQGGRGANKLHDMDFWSDAGASVYRPRYTIEKLRESPFFTYLPGHLAVKFVSEPGAVKLQCRRVMEGGFETLTTRRLLLAAGALGTGRLALNSLGDETVRLPILCNPNHWIATLNLAMLGRPARDARHSLAQLTALQRCVGDPDDYVLAQFYSYRSLLLFRLLKDIPLPPTLALLFVRLLVTAMTLINVHYSDRPDAARRYVRLTGRREDGAGELRVVHDEWQSDAAALAREERALMMSLLRVGCVPMGVTRPAAGASIHYAGTVPLGGDGPLATDEKGALRGFPGVTVADGSSWRFLPGKGLTMTLMANARRVADGVCAELQEGLI